MVSSTRLPSTENTDGFMNETSTKSPALMSSSSPTSSMSPASASLACCCVVAVGLPLLAAVAATAVLLRARTRVCFERARARLLHGPGHSENKPLVLCAEQATAYRIVYAFVYVCNPYIIMCVHVYNGGGGNNGAMRCVFFACCLLLLLFCFIGINMNEKQKVRVHNRKHSLHAPHPHIKHIHIYIDVYSSCICSAAKRLFNPADSSNVLC